MIRRAIRPFNLMSFPRKTAGMIPNSLSHCQWGKSGNCNRCRGRPGTDASTDADGRGVSMRMEEPPPCGWTARRAKRREAVPRQAVMPRRNPPGDTMITSPRPTDSSIPEVAFHKGEPFSPESPAISTTTTTYCLLGGDNGLAPARGYSSQHGHWHRKGKW